MGYEPAGGAAAEPPASAEPWLFLVVDDSEDVRVDLKEEFEGQQVAGRDVVVRSFASFDDALSELAERRGDLLILDVYEGNPAKGGEKKGLAVLDKVRTSAFVNVILYTAAPEAVKDLSSPLVRVVGKEAKGGAALRAVVEQIFESKVPQALRALARHLDKTLHEYMWDFVERKWDMLEPVSKTPEFLRLLVRRLAASLGREGVNRMTAQAFGIEADEAPDAEEAHPSEFYIIPPFSGDVRFGDIREIAEKEWRVVVWPSCDMVTTQGRALKTDRATCARALLLSETTEMKTWAQAPEDKSAKSAVSCILRNQRNKTPERFHFLPEFLWVPDLVVDFQDVERLPVVDLAKAHCLATVASPFAEHLNARYLRYIGRPGVPDLKEDRILSRIKAGMGAPKK
jgi:CheY-like chemotaxis protein